MPQVQNLQFGPGPSRALMSKMRGPRPLVQALQGPDPSYGESDPSYGESQDH